MTTDGAKDLLRSSSVSLWRQLSDTLRQQIADGVLEPGGRLPTEPELGERYGVSRITVRAAIDQLLAEELVVRKQGKGTFVAARVVRQELSDLIGIIPNLKAQGIRFQTRLISFGQEPAPPRIAAALKSGSDPVLHLRRLYLFGDKPFGLCDVWIPDAENITREEAERSPSYTILTRHLGRAVAQADLVIKVKRPDRAVARLIDIGRSEPLMCLERSSQTVAGRTGEYTLFWVRPDQYEFGISVQGPMPIAKSIVRAA